jgi:hypothetical protein
MAYAGGGAVAAYAAIAQAIKASGAIVDLKPEEFIKILAKTKDPLVVTAKGGMFKPVYGYLTNYKGLVFHTRSPEPLMLPGSAEVVVSKQIWIPG